MKYYTLIMRKELICSYLLFFLISASYGQEIKIKVVPYSMHFENDPLGYKILGDDKLQISASANTDLFISPDEEYEINKSPRLLFKPDSDFIFTSKIKLNFISK